MRLEQIVPGRTPSAGLSGAILTRDLSIAGRRLPKGTRLSPEDLALVAEAPAGAAVTVLVPDPGDVHEDDAAVRLAAAVVGEGAAVTPRGPVQSRLDLVATAAGVVEVRLAALERLNRMDPLEVFTVFDGQVVEPGDLVASVKIAPHLVPEAILVAGESVARRGGPLVGVRPFRPVRLAAVVKERVTGAARSRFETSIQSKAEGMGARLGMVAYVRDDVVAVTEALGAAIAPGPLRAAIVLTAGGASTNPADPFFLAVEAMGGRIVRHGVPSHPGSMLWLAVIGRAAIVGLPSCGAYSMATAADLLLPRLVAGQPPTAATVARLAHGGILNRSQRFRFPPYARHLEPPQG